MCGINSEKEITRLSVIYVREMKDSEWTTVSSLKLGEQSVVEIKVWEFLTYRHLK